MRRVLLTKRDVTMKKTNNYQMAVCAFMAALLCILGPWSIPIGPVPVTLATLVLYLTIVLLGWKPATVSCGLYLLLGFAGLPVFSGFQSGVGRLAGPTGGYLIGYLFVTIIGGWIMESCRMKTWITVVGFTAATAVLYVFGTIWFVAETRCDVAEALAICVVPFVPFDLIKIVSAVFLGKAVKKALGKAGLLPEKQTARELSAEYIMQQLDAKAKKFYRVECVKVVDSTNIAVRDRGMQGEAEGLCIVAEEQTEGRGRRGRSFSSPKASGIYFSILLRPEMSFEDSVWITTAAAVAAAEACERVNDSLKKGEVQIKWVNDLFLDGRKFCGILTEGFLSREHGGLDCAVLGVGFNISPPQDGWAEEIKDIAGSLFQKDVPAGCRNRLVSYFLNAFLPYYKNLKEHLFLEEYRTRQLAIGKEVTVLQADGSKQKAKAIGVDDNCRLLVQYEDRDAPVALDSSEISVRMH